MFTGQLAVREPIIRGMESAVKLRMYGIREYRPNIHLNFERGGFIVKTASNGEDLEACLRLRFQVFHKEYRNVKTSLGLDVDTFDARCDHLMIVDKKSNQLVGTYRLNSSLFSDRYYSATEFRIGNLLDLPGTKLELGRACILSEFRTGSVLALLWRGIADYIRLTETAFMFGCVSIKITSRFEIAEVTRYLREKGHISTELGITPTLRYTPLWLAGAHIKLDQVYDAEVAKRHIPPLLNFYLKTGVKICGLPALDRKFNCIDFLVLLEVGSMNSTVKSKYGL